MRTGKSFADVGRRELRTAEGHRPLRDADLLATLFAKFPLPQGSLCEFRAEVSRMETGARLPAD